MGIDIQYIVSFVRIDGQPDENYVYWQKEDAEHHMSLFANDDSGLYKRIELLLWDKNKAMVLKKLQFA